MAIVVLTLGLAVFITILFFCISRVARKNNGRMAPGPTPLPIIGNLHQMGKLPHRGLQQLAEKYGPIMSLRLGSIPTLVVSSSEAAKLFLKTHDLVFANRPVSAAGKYIFYDQKDIIFGSYGPFWRNMRKICLLELLTPKRIESFRSVREEGAKEMIRSIWEESRQGKVQVDLSETVASFASNSTWRILTGRTYGDRDLSGGGLGFKGMMDEISFLVGAFDVGELIPGLGWLDLLGLKRRMKKVHLLLDGLMEKIMDEHVERRRSGLASGNDKDLVDVLLDLQHTMADMEITRRDIKAIVFDMFSAGMETSTTTLEWAMSEIVQNPHVMKKLQEEIESIVGKDQVVTESNLIYMEYLHCVVKETLRLYPVAPLLIPHESTEDCTVKGPHHAYFIPAKTRLLVNAWAIGRDPNIWEDPLAFNPERFMGTKLDVIKDQECSMIPFGEGRRGCPGASLAIKTLEIVLAHLFHCFDWKTEGDVDMTEVFGATIPRKVHLFALPTWRLGVNVP
uniref:CYP750B2 n=1 Tax=Taxus chinensis TaxID=29808 RepID=A0A291FAY9_TAXCH|nr:CYP750B2 [Taxus chinensis]